jgi:hypothetical protein
MGAKGASGGGAPIHNVTPLTMTVERRAAEVQIKSVLNRVCTDNFVCSLL